MFDSLAPEHVVPHLRGRFGHDYRYASSCPSTQRMLGPDAPEGAVAVAEEQTEGRGRLGRRWDAPPGTSVLCSVLLRPDVEPARLPELSLVAAQACAEAIRTVTLLAPEVKFPNDVLIEGRKVAGILGEATEGVVVLGLGVNANLTPEQLPRDVRVPATSLLIETGTPLDRVALLTALLEQLERRYDEWRSR